jgi:CelD/BcsL family acetyltransferase involved in cellulose biosynthesis
VDIEVTRPGALAPKDLARWSALQAPNPVLDTPFLSPGWALAVERAQQGCCDADPSRGVRVAVMRDGGEAKGFFSARVAGSLAMPAGAPMNDYQGLVASPDLTLDPKALIAALGVQRLDFTHMLEGQPAFASYRRGEAVSYRAETPDGFAAYAESRREAGSGVLKDIDKRRRKIEREVGPVVFTAQSRSTTAFDQLIAWKRAQYGCTRQTDIFDTPWTLRLLRDLLGGHDPAFGGALFTLHVGDQLAAAQFNLRGSKTLHAWIIAHDEAFERYSPGLILFGEVLRWMDESPYKVLDLGAGDYRFKQQLSNARVMVGHGFVGRPSPATLIRSAEYGVRAAAEALPLGRFSELPGKAMRRMDLLRGLR